MTLTFKKQQQKEKGKKNLCFFTTYAGTEVLLTSCESFTLLSFTCSVETFYLFI